MKKFLFLFFLLVMDVNAQGHIYISKRDIDTNQYVNDCSFILYDNDGNVVDSWIQDNSTHVSNVEFGTYRLFESPTLMEASNDELGQQLFLNVNNEDVFEVTLYNQKIETPRNLKYSKNFFISVFFIMIGCFIIFFSCKYCFF